MLLYSAANGLDATAIPTDHPLQAMTTPELKDIVLYKEEWGPDNYAVAKALLEQRGETVAEQEVINTERARMQHLTTAKQMPVYWLVVGYASAVVPVMANGRWFNPYENTIQGYEWYFPGLIGFAVGMVILNGKVTLPDGRRISQYTRRTQLHGLYIIGLNIVAWIAGCIMLLFTA